MALSYKVFPGTPYYSNTNLTTKAGEIVNTTAATYVNTTYGTVSVGGSTYYVAYGQMVSFWNSSYTGTQIDNAVGKVLSPDSTPTENSTNLVTSGGVKSAITHDLANIVATGTTNTTGAVIASGTYFYLNGTLARAKADIAVNATFTSGTNYEAVTAGGLNSLKSAMVKLGSITGTTGSNADLQFGNDFSKVVIIAAFPDRGANTDSYLVSVATNVAGTTQFCRVLDGNSRMMTNTYVKIWYAYIEI